MAIQPKVELQAGLWKEVIRPGTGDNNLKINDQVTVHCTGMLSGSNKIFWSTRIAGQPFTFTVGIGEVIAGWDAGCLSMKEGEVAKLFISSELGYGSSGYSSWNIPPGADLVYELEVLSIVRR